MVRMDLEAHGTVRSVEWVHPPSSKGAQCLSRSLRRLVRVATTRRKEMTQVVTDVARVAHVEWSSHGVSRRWDRPTGRGVVPLLGV